MGIERLRGLTKALLGDDEYNKSHKVEEPVIKQKKRKTKQEIEAELATTKKVNEAAEKAAKELEEAKAKSEASKPEVESMKEDLLVFDSTPVKKEKRERKPINTSILDEVKANLRAKEQERKAKEAEAAKKAQEEAEVKRQEELALAAKIAAEAEKDVFVESSKEDEAIKFASQFSVDEAILAGAVAGVARDKVNNTEKKAKPKIRRKATKKDIAECKEVFAEELTAWGISSESFGYTLIISIIDVYKYKDRYEDIIPKLIKATGKTKAVVMSSLSALVRKANFKSSKYLPLLSKVKTEAITVELVINELADICEGMFIID